MRKEVYAITEWKRMVSGDLISMRGEVGSKNCGRSVRRQMNIYEWEIYRQAQCKATRKDGIQTMPNRNRSSIYYKRRDKGRKVNERDLDKTGWLSLALNPILYTCPKFQTYSAGRTTALCQITSLAVLAFKFSFKVKPFASLFGSLSYKSSSRVYMELK